MLSLGLLIEIQYLAVYNAQFQFLPVMFIVEMNFTKHSKLINSVSEQCFLLDLTCVVASTEAQTINHLFPSSSVS